MATSAPSGPGRRRIGVLGGSFNPPHIGHLVIASQAHHELDLDVVLLMPAWAPPHKLIEDDLTAEVRLALTRAAVGEDRRLVASSLEIERRSRFTVDTLSALAAAADDAELWFIAGSDSLLALPTWKEPERLLDLVRFAVAARPGDDPDTVADAVLRWRARLLDSPPIALSSTELRARVRAGAPVRYLVPEPVERLIARLGLYRGVSAGDAPKLTDGAGSP